MKTHTTAARKLCEQSYQRALRRGEVLVKFLDGRHGSYSQRDTEILEIISVVKSLRGRGRVTIGDVANELERGIRYVYPRCVECCALEIVETGPVRDRELVQLWGVEMETGH